MPYQDDPPPTIREYRLVPRKALAGTNFVLATDEGEPIIYEKKKAAVPGYPEDPRTATRTAPVFSVRVPEGSMKEKCEQITKALRRYFDMHPASIRVKIHGILCEWHVSNKGVERVRPGSSHTH